MRLLIDNFDILGGGGGGGWVFWGEGSLWDGNTPCYTLTHEQSGNLLIWMFNFDLNFFMIGKRLKEF